MDGYLTVKQASEKWNVSIRTVQTLCAMGRIVGVTKIANVWLIPETAKYPNDRRVKSGKYKNWRSRKTTAAERDY